MPGWVAGHSKQHGSCCLLDRWTRPWYYCCCRHISTLVASYNVWKPKSRRQFRSRMLIENRSHFRLEAVPKMITEKVSRKKISSFGSVGLMIDFEARKRSFPVLQETFRKRWRSGVERDATVHAVVVSKLVPSSNTSQQYARVLWRRCVYGLSSCRCGGFSLILPT